VFTTALQPEKLPPPTLQVATSRAATLQGINQSANDTCSVCGAPTGLAGEHYLVSTGSSPSPQVFTGPSVKLPGIGAKPRKLQLAREEAELEPLPLHCRH